MTREDIIRMAREAGLAYGSDEKPLGSVTRFAALVAEHERDQCALIAAHILKMPQNDVSAAIRARSNT